MKTRIHVNQRVIQRVIQRNRKHGTKDPPITVKTYKSNVYVHQVVIHGPSKLVYAPDDPLSCGARLWIETEAKVTTDVA